MNGQEALRIVDRLLEQQRQPRLRDVQRSVMLAVLERHCYSTIAQELGYETDYIKHVAAQLWQLLSKPVGEKVTKGNVESVLQRYQATNRVVDGSGEIEQVIKSTPDLPQMLNIKIILVDPVSDLCAAWEEEFYGIEAVSIVNNRFESLTEYDCMVSAGNSFGLMDGGVDLAITRYFGVELMDRVQLYILHNFRGEQSVGTSFIIETLHPKHPFLAHTPTMRVPMAISTTDYVYKAMWAMLLAVWQHNQHSSNQIRTIACPGLGTATGQVPFTRAAKQMALAYKNFVHPPASMNWLDADRRQKSIGAGGDIID